MKEEKIKMIEDIRLKSTCGSCPEQYDAFLGDKQVGYLRLRHGYFRVESGGKTIYEAYPRGDGLFESDERDFYLEMAKKAIIGEITMKEDEWNAYTAMKEMVKNKIDWNKPRPLIVHPDTADYFQRVLDSLNEESEND